jgi:hypothetical protein
MINVQNYFFINLKDPFESCFIKLEIFLNSLTYSFSKSIKNVSTFKLKSDLIFEQLWKKKMNLNNQ